VKGNSEREGRKERGEVKISVRNRIHGFSRNPENSGFPWFPHPKPVPYRRKPAKIGPSGVSVVNKSVLFPISNPEFGVFRVLPFRKLFVE
jgi:hypothetical protein